MIPALGYNRILLKLSGEALAGGSEILKEPHQKSCFNTQMLEKISQDIKQVHRQNIQISIVIGGGNIYRGAQGLPALFTRATSDQMGMLATMINGLALRDVLRSRDIPCCLMSSIPIASICETYTAYEAIDCLEKGKVVICVAGTGNPYFTTDTAAILRASELNCDLLLKATKVSGVYDTDPQKNPHANFFPTLSYQEVIQKDLKVMDTTAIILAQENQIPIAVFSIYENNGLGKVMDKTGSFSLIS